MPIYDYTCTNCGPFTEWQSMSLSAAPFPCPTCDRQSERALSAPYIANMDPFNRIAHQRNEKSADTPKMSSTPSANDEGGSSKHKGHACSGHHGHKHKHGPSRPWMIGH
ncbi:zinc ribbon domain-containing protein [Pelagibius sp. Alg239-R121]|uniref:FmdB family zinc ribbon protein n=1 Tax=Pelagibius sp. Alg239-R121 TaxID=2993448 RepID=UPI0024A72FE5|nr:zinc ribbon domain-containing protein [Pelagibius sp. Alg239-R121]